MTDENRIIIDAESKELIEQEAQNKKASSSNRFNANPDNVEEGLAKLVLTVIELIRRLMEKQAMHRIENNSLTDDEIEEMGLTFMKLEEKMQELKETFNLQNEDLNIDLGPLGNLM